MKGITESIQSNPSRRVLIPLGIGIAISLLGDSTLYTVLPDPDIAAQAGLTLAMVGILLGINRIVRILFNSTAGILIDRISRRGLMIGSLCLGVLSTAIFAFGRGFHLLLIGRVFWGAAWSGLWIGGNTIVLDISTPDNRGRLSAQFQMWFFLGVGCTALIGGLFTDLFGFRGGMWISTALTGSVVFFWLLYLPETRPSGIFHLENQQTIRPATFPWRLAISAAVPVFVGRFVFAGVMASTTILWLSEYLGRQLVTGWFVIPIASLTGGVIALRAGASVAGAPLAGFLSDQLRRRWLVLAGVLTLGAVGVYFSGSASILLALLGAMIAAVAGGGVNSLAPAITGDSIHETRHGRALGLLYTVGDFASAIGPPIALSLVEAMPIRVIYRLCSSLFLAAALFALYQAIVEKRMHNV
jgi:MFS family permease